MPNAGVPLSFNRSYNSQASRDVGFGIGWTHSFSDRIIRETETVINQGNPEEQATDNLIWYTAEGVEHRFEWDGVSAYKTPSALLGTLSGTPGGSTWKFTDRDGRVVEFEKPATFSQGSVGQNDREPLGRLKSKTDLNGHGVIVNYVPTSSDQIKDVRDARTPVGAASADGRRRLEFDYSLTDVIQVYKHDGPTYAAAPVVASPWQFTVENGLLRQVKHPNSDDGEVKYLYKYFGDTDNPNTHDDFDNLLLSMVAPNGDETRYEYYFNKQLYKTAKVIEPAAGGVAERLTEETYSYDLVNGKTTIRDDKGNETTYSYNEDGLVTRMVNPDRTFTETVWGVAVTEDDLNPAGQPTNDADGDGFHDDLDMDKDGVFDGTEYLRTRVVDEVGAVQRFEYVLGGDFDRELETAYSNRYETASGTLVPGQLDSTKTDYTYVKKTSSGMVETVRVNTITVDDPDGTDRVTTFAYDDLGRVTSETDAENNKTTFTYHASGAGAGLVESRTSPRGANQGTNADPNDALDWHVLDTGFLVNGDKLTVTLERQNAGKSVTADAIRIERIDQDGDGQLIRVIDNNDPDGFVTPSGALPVGGGDPRYDGEAISFENDNVATWTFERLVPGSYRVATTWVADGAGGSDSQALYTLYDGDVGAASTPVVVDQTLAPSAGDSYNAFTLHFEYDAAGNVRKTTRGQSDQSGSGLLVNEVEYHHTGSVESSVDGTGFKTRSEYDDLGRLREAILDGDASTVADDLASVYSYDASGQPRFSTDAESRTTETIYDGRGLVTEVVYADSTSMTYEYDGVGNRTAMTDELGRRTSYEYDSRNRLIATIHPDGTSERFRYDGVGRRVEAVDELGRTSRVTYDAGGRQVKSTVAVETANEAVSRTKYNVLGEVVETIDPNGNVTQFVYDDLGRVVKSMVLGDQYADEPSKDNRVATLSAALRPIQVGTTGYDPEGNVVETIIYDTLLASSKIGSSDLRDDDLRDLLDGSDDTLGTSDDLGAGSLDETAYLRTTQAFDGFNRPTTTTYADGTTTSVEYDAAGRVRFNENEEGARSEVRYDKYSRQIETLAPDPVTGEASGTERPASQTEYDRVGNVTATIDPNGNRTEFEYDARHRLVATTDGVGSTGHTLYDVAGQTVATIDAYGVAVAMQYDNRGRVTRRSWVDPDGSALPSAAPIETFTYDLAGNLESSTDPRGHTTEYTYDDRDRVETTSAQRTQRDGDRDNPSLGEAAGGDAVTIHGYDANSNLTSLTDANGGVTTYTYDAVNRRTSETLPAPQDLASNPTLVFTSVYDGYSNVVRLLEQPGNASDPTRIDKFRFDTRNRLVAEVFNAVDTSDLANVSVVQSLVPPLPTTDTTLDRVRNDYFYDEVGRIITAETATDSSTIGAVTRSEYDKLGRLITQRLDAPNGNEDGRHDVAYEYDQAGNVTTETATIRADAQFGSTITQSILLSTSTTQYQYDGLNRQIVAIEDPTGINARTTTGYDAVGNPVLSIDATGLATRNEYDDLYRLVAVTQADPNPYDSVTSPLATTYEHDTAGNVVRETNGEDDVTEYLYDTFGQVVEARNIFSGSDDIVTAYAYDKLGNQITVKSYRNSTDANETRFEYDLLNRVKTETQENGADDRVREYRYDAVGDLSQAKDRNGRVTTYQYDGLDRLVAERWYADEASLGGSHDNILVWQHDKLGRLIAQGNQYESAPADSDVYIGNHVETFSYDDLDRLTEQRNYLDDASISFTAQSNLLIDDSVERFNPEIEQRYTHDRFLSGFALIADAFNAYQYEQVIEPNGSNAVYADSHFVSDKLGRTTTIVDTYRQVIDSAQTGPNTRRGKRIDFTYDAAGRMLSTLRQASRVDEGKPDSFDSEGALDFSFQTNYGYDPSGRLGSIDHYRVTQTGPFATYAYGYDKASRITTIDAGTNFSSLQLTRNESYTYDDAGRLAEWSQDRRDRGGVGPDLSYTSPVVEDYGLDATGNRTDDNQDVGAHNRVSSDGNYAYDYDHEGNLTQRLSPDRTNLLTSYTWDHRNRLVQVEDHATGVITEYGYNNDDLRVNKIVYQTDPGGIEQIDFVEFYAYNGDQLAAVVDGITTQETGGERVTSNGVYQRRVQGGVGTDQPLFEEVFRDEALADLDGLDHGSDSNQTGLYWAATDHAGTVRDVIDNDNVYLVDHLEYDAHGVLTAYAADESLRNDNALAIDSAFAGRDWDNEVGLYYNRARWYDAAQSRFISEDPIGFAGGDLNVYRYGGGDPANYRDPSGLFLDKIWRETKRVIDDVGDFIEDSGDFIEKEYKDTVRTVEYIARNPDDAFKAAVKDPKFWAAMAVGSVGFSFGFFNVNLGLNGFSSGINFLGLGKQALSLATGGTINVGLPTISVSSPLLSTVNKLVGAFTSSSVEAGASQSKRYVDFAVNQAGYDEDSSYGPDYFPGISEPRPTPPRGPFEGMLDARKQREFFRQQMKEWNGRRRDAFNKWKSTVTEGWDVLNLTGQWRMNTKKFQERRRLIGESLLDKTIGFTVSSELTGPAIAGPTRSFTELDYTRAYGLYSWDTRSGWSLHAGPAVGNKGGLDFSLEFFVSPNGTPLDITTGQSVSIETEVPMTVPVYGRPIRFNTGPVHTAGDGYEAYGFSVARPGPASVNVTHGTEIKSPIDLIREFVQPDKP